jgi:hypothetical protein
MPWVTGRAQIIAVKVVTDAKVSERHVEHQVQRCVRDTKSTQSVVLKVKDAKMTRMGQEVVGGMKWLGARSDFGGV